MAAGTTFTPLQQALLLFMTAGVTVTNGVKTCLAALFTDRRRVFGCGLENASQQIKALLPQVLEVMELEGLRGLEGLGATAYFGVFDHLLLRRKESPFAQRQRRP